MDQDVEKFKKIFSWIQGIVLIIMAIYVLYATMTYLETASDCEVYCKMMSPCMYENYVSDITNFSELNISIKIDEWES